MVRNLFRFHSSLLTFTFLFYFYSSSMPVMERGIGLDRTYHRLPVLFVDDYSHITPSLLRQVRKNNSVRGWDYWVCQCKEG